MNSDTKPFALPSNTEAESDVKPDTIKDFKLQPNFTDDQIQGSDRICHPCLQNADRVPVPAPPAKNVPTINLPDFTRAPDTQANCFCPNCESPQQLTVPTWLRIKLFTEFNFYVPKNCRICELHLSQDNWDEVLTTFVHPCHTFTAEHIEDFSSFLKQLNKI